MFPYRRHGSKKRVKQGPGGRNQPPRIPQKGLPNSARDLLPLLQPATKALAHMLGGRTPSSGQLGHARALLAHTERLIGERQHNRLNPGEREEFFEQLARLRLTLADAESEAELQAAEDQAPPRPLAQPVARERLKELALALASPEARAAAGPEPESGETAVPMPDGDRSEAAPARAGPSADDAAAADDPPAAAEPAPRPSRPGRLGLSEVAAREAASALMTAPVRRPVTSRRKRLMPVAERTGGGGEPGEDGEPGEGSAEGTGGAPQAGSHNGAAPQTDDGDPRPRSDPARRPRPAPKKTRQGLPEGWVIDEDGFVVPGPS